MLTPTQEKWLVHLSNKDKIKIIPFDPSAKEKFRKVRKRIQSALGNAIKVEHRGATKLGISGQDEIDIYIPVPPDRFDLLLESLKEIFGAPKSLYPLERARFVTDEEGKHIDVFLINKNSIGWIGGVRFEKYLKSHPKTLNAYQKLKEEGIGLNTREYYRRKIEFINNILAKLPDKIH